MINPNHIPPKSSPYSYSSSGQAVYRSGLPRTMAVPVPKKKSKLRKIVGLTALSIFVAAATYAFAQYSSFRNNVIVARNGEASAILKYNDITQLDSSYFKQAGDGRFNIVVLGIGGDNHPGATLTDTIQVVSVDTINKKVNTTSIPRDLFVSIPGYGKAKINATYTYAENQKKDSGGAVTKDVVASVIGARVSNFVMIDFAGAKEIIDAIGGIDINVPKAIYDPYFPDDATVGYSPFNITAGPHHMDGNTALRYSRSRETTSDFDRSFRQQLVMKAMKQKALSAGVLSNPLKVSNLIGALGRHIKTDMQPDEIKTFMEIYKDIPAENSSAQVLDTSDKLGLLTSSTDEVAGYIAYPWLGVDNFRDVQAWFAKNNTDPFITKEKATITVAGTGKATAKQLQTIVAILNDYGYTATLSTQTASSSASQTTLYEKKSGSKPISHNYLSSYFSVESKSGTPLSSGSDFELIYVPRTQK